MSGADPTLAADLRSWVPVPDGSPYPIQNLPYGSFSRDGASRALGVAIGDHVLDLTAATHAGLFDDVPGARTTLATPSLNALLAASQEVWSAVRGAISALLSVHEPRLRDHPARDRLLVPKGAIRMHLPFDIGDYVDFYSGFEHATTMGRLFRPDSDGLLPQWRHLPMAYHGRTSTIALSGTPIRRPCGLLPSASGEAPEYGPSAQLDYEVELGCVIGGRNDPGEPVPIARAGEHVFGFVLLNDWSARDIQRYEYVPFGPFVGKSMLTSISPWVVTTAALAPWRVPGPDQSPTPADYLCTSEPWNLDLALETRLQTKTGAAAGHAPQLTARANARTLYWNCAQWLAHTTVGGASIRPGDLFGSGTISGWEPHEKGCLAERTSAGNTAFTLPDGESRTFLEDGDTVEITGWCDSDRTGYRIGFGSVTGTVGGRHA